MANDDSKQPSQANRGTGGDTIEYGESTCNTVICTVIPPPPPPKKK